MEDSRLKLFVEAQLANKLHKNVEHEAEREEIRSPVQRLAAQLLGRHVDHRADHRAGARQAALLERRPADQGDHFGEPEIQDLRLAARRQEDVRRLEIAMNQAVGVRRIECIGEVHMCGGGDVTSGGRTQKVDRPPWGCIDISTPEVTYTVIVH